VPIPTLGKVLGPFSDSPFVALGDFSCLSQTGGGGGQGEELGVTFFFSEIVVWEVKDLGVGSGSVLE
jgi:hypothetical protein